MWARQVAAAAAVASAAVAASCGTSGSGGVTEDPVAATGSTGDPAGAGAEGGRVRACVVFTLDEVAELVDGEVTAGPTPTHGGTGCQWTAEVVDPDAATRESHVVELMFRDPGTALDQALTVEGEAAPVTGLGEEALVATSTTSFPAVMAGYRDAERVVTLRYEVQVDGPASGADPRTRADAVVAALRSLQATLAAPG